MLLVARHSQPSKHRNLRLIAYYLADRPSLPTPKCWYHLFDIWSHSLWRSAWLLGTECSECSRSASDAASSSFSSLLLYLLLARQPPLAAHQLARVRAPYWPCYPLVPALSAHALPSRSQVPTTRVLTPSTQSILRPHHSPASRFQTGTQFHCNPAPFLSACLVLPSATGISFLPLVSVVHFRRPFADTTASSAYLWICSAFTNTYTVARCCQSRYTYDYLQKFSWRREWMRSCTCHLIAVIRKRHLPVIAC